MKRFFAKLAALFFLVAVIFGGYEMYLKNPAPAAPETTITIANGASLSEVAAQLKEAGVISSGPLFTLAAELVGKAKQIHPGTFVMKPGMSISDALNTLSFVGKNEISVTFPEGFNLSEIAGRLKTAGVIADENAFYSVAGRPGEEAELPSELVSAYPFLSGTPNLEGYLFPDTYRFYGGSTGLDIVKKMLNEYKAKVLDLGVSREALTLASIVEKEVPDEVDRELVADIFKRRLAVGMPLQADSTVNYALGKSELKLNVNDLAVASSYNTYKNAGLPPGPIANPGLSAINAALHPKSNPYWYFLTTKDGVVIYSRTLDEHNVNKAKYLK